MPNTREKLIELLQGARDKYINLLSFEKELIADHLIANDVVPVVRCKDCRDCMMCYPEKQLDKEATQAWICNRFKRYCRPDDFCSYGERKDNG